MPPIRIALLLCGGLSGAALERHPGDYLGLYTRYLTDTFPTASISTETRTHDGGAPPFALDPYFVWRDAIVDERAYPDPAAYDALVLTGSASSAYDDTPWITALCAYIARVANTVPRVRIIAFLILHPRPSYLTPRLPYPPPTHSLSHPTHSSSSPHALPSRHMLRPPNNRPRPRRRLRPQRRPLGDRAHAHRADRLGMKVFGAHGGAEEEGEEMDFFLFRFFVLSLQSLSSSPFALPSPFPLARDAYAQPPKPTPQREPPSASHPRETYIRFASARTHAALFPFGRFTKARAWLPPTVCRL
ncbi:hypothetical protein BJ912DRAFT_1098172 [Pholiota molesta]|nr:hypothetical protein BJ912DRAFT_1098172 [Pholiota molesta]